MTVRDLLNAASGQSTTPLYVDDVFSTYLYTGTGATQSINNGIDLATKGGMTWIKSRSATTNNNLFDTTQGATKLTHSNATAATVTDANSLTAFNTTGFTLGTGSTTNNEVNVSAATYASWSFRKQPKFFNIVKYTGTGAAQAINHSLGSTPGCIMVKQTDTTGNWAVYHKGLNSGTTPEQYVSFLNTTAANASTSNWNNTAPTSTQFTVGISTTTNASGGTYIAYIFADQAGGFGANGTDNAVACGNYTGNGSSSGPFVSLGWEPQWVLIKDTTSATNWVINDVMRGMSYTGAGNLNPNLANAESTATIGVVQPNPTGFTIGTTSSVWNTSGDNYIYIAIRRPMKPPTTGTSVFSPTSVAISSSPYTITTGFPVDLTILTATGASYQRFVADRLRGDSQTSSTVLEINSTSAEIPFTFGLGYDNNSGFIDNGLNTGLSPDLSTYWNFRRASGFFDEVCYTGTGAATTQAHNLGVAPEMMIVKERSAANNWWVYHSATGNAKYSVLNTTAIPVISSTAWNNTTPTASVFSIGTGTPVNNSTQTYVAYLFATCAGVSKVGTYTGNATGQSIACGFGSSGARFILIKRTDATGDWYCFDSANGLTSSSSPYMTWDTTNAQTTGNNGVYASSGGFTLGATASLTTNISTATYIFLAIA